MCFNLPLKEEAICPEELLFGSQEEEFIRLAGSYWSTYQEDRLNLVRPSLTRGTLFGRVHSIGWKSRGVSIKKIDLTWFDQVCVVNVQVVAICSEELLFGS